MQVGLIVIGTEIMTGKRRDGHLGFVIEALRTRGLDLSWCQYLGDDPPRLTGLLRSCLESQDVVFSFGGIGATPDDHTRQCAADAAGLPLAPHPQACAIIEERFGEDAYPQRIKMAHLPTDSILIPNPVNKIAGFSVGNLHFVPGFPQMGQPMVEWVLDEHYRHLHRSEPPAEFLATLPGVSEGQLMGVMNNIVSRFPEVALSCLPHMDGDYRETELGLRGDAEEVERAKTYLRSALRHANFDWRESARSSS